MHLEVALRSQPPVSRSFFRRGRPVSAILVLCAGLAVLCIGCAGTAWQRALDADSAATYHRFLREYPDSLYVADARERIAFHQVMRRPTLEGYQEFREAYPDSALLERMRPGVERLAFDAARRAGTASAYARFEELFPAGPYARKVKGNVVYLRLAARRKGGAAPTADPRVLNTFAEAHPESDYAAEAMRTVAALTTRDRSRFDHVTLLVEVSPGTPEAARVRKAFVESAVKVYDGIPVVLVVGSPKAPLAKDTVTLRIAHSEEAESAHVDGVDVSRSGLMVRTEVTLGRAVDPEPIWHREFVVRVPPHEVIPNASALFSSKQARLYWDEFFVPVATWRSSVAVRSPVAAERPVAAVDASEGRAVVLFEDGGFEWVELADPEQPLRVARHERQTKLEHFEGVRIHGGRVLVWGQDGLEVVRYEGVDAGRLATRPRGEVGSISALVPVRDGLLLASSRGLLFTDPTGADAKRVMRRAVLGLDGNEERLVFADGESIYVTTLALLRSGRVLEQFRIGRTFEPARVRVAGRLAVVMGEGGVILIDLPAGGKPRLASRLERRDVGEVRDALRIGGRVYLVGSRGLQLLDRENRRVAESVDVLPRSRFATTGRHLVVVGEGHLQVVDVLPFSRVAARPVPANPGAASAKP